MNIDFITEEWARDSAIDRNDLVAETLRTPQLHAKYLNLVMQCRGKLIKIQQDYNELRATKTRYYRGEMDKSELEELGWLQYQGLKPLKSDMDAVLSGDSDLNRVKLRIEYLETMQYQLESILQNIKGRDWGIKNHIEYTKFMAGS